jgi:hypothetical protein
MTHLRHASDFDRDFTAARRKPDDLFYRFEAQLTFTPIGLVPEGLRMGLAFEGRVVQGLLEGARVWGSDPLVIRPDGVGVLDVHKMIAFGGANMYEHVRGFCAPPAELELPALEAIAQPGFQFPDVPFPITGFSTFAAPSGPFEHLNRRIARIDGHSSFATGRLVIEARLVAPEVVDGVVGAVAAMV